MNYVLKSWKELDRAAWESLRAGYDGGTVYHSWEWAGLWPSAFPGMRAGFLLAVEAQEYEYGLPLVLKGRYPFLRIYSMPMGGYGGLLYRPHDGRRAEGGFTGMFKMLSRLRPCYLEIVDFEGRMDFLTRLGFVRHEACTHLVDLEEFGKLPRQRRKRGAVQAERRGLRIAPAADGRELEAAYELLQLRDRRYGQATKYPLHFYELIRQRLVPLGMASIDLAWEGRQVIGFMVSLVYRQNLIYWDGASHPDFLSRRPADALMQHLIDHGLESKCRWLNLGSSPPGARGLIRFKEQWGGRPRRYYIYRRANLLYKLWQRLKP